LVNKTKSIKQVRAIRCSQRNDGCRAALRPPIPNRRRSALGGAEKFLLPPREQDVAQRSAVVGSVDGRRPSSIAASSSESSTATSSSRIGVLTNSAT